MIFFLIAFGAICAALLVCACLPPFEIPRHDEHYDAMLDDYEKGKWGEEGRMTKDYLLERLGANRYTVSVVPPDFALRTDVVPEPLKDSAGKTREFFSFSCAVKAARADLEESE